MTTKKDAYSKLISDVKAEIEKVQNAKTELDWVDQDEGEVEDLHSPLKRINHASWRLIQLIHAFEAQMMHGLEEASALADLAPDLNEEPKLSCDDF